MSFQRPWPPPYLYGLLAISLPAAMMSLTCCGAESGATARPSAPSVACSPGTVGALASVVPSSVSPRSTDACSATCSETLARPFARRAPLRSQVLTARFV